MGYVIYEVNLEIENAIAKDYMEWLRPHIDIMLQFEGFQSAKVMLLLMFSLLVSSCSDDL